MRKRTVFEVGQKYGMLTIVEKCGYDKYNNRLYKCKCDCGNYVTVRGNALSSGNTKSCGCYSKKVKMSKRLPDSKGVINQIILQYKRHARDRGLCWELSYDEVKEIIDSPCYYCGLEKTNHKVTKNCKEGYFHNGIDRVDNSMGYVIGNVVPCCRYCNRAKCDMSKEDFINWAKKVVDHSEN